VFSLLTNVLIMDLSYCCQSLVYVRVHGSRLTTYILKGDVNAHNEPLMDPNLTVNIMFVWFH